APHAAGPSAGAPGGVLPPRPGCRTPGGPRHARRGARVPGLSARVRLPAPGRPDLGASGAARPIRGHPAGRLEGRRHPERAPEEEADVVKRRTIVILVVLAVAAAAAFWILRARTREQPLTFSGSIEARDVEVGSLVGGRVASVLIDEGSSVKAG